MMTLGRLYPTSIRSTFQMVFAYDQLEERCDYMRVARLH